MAKQTFTTGQVLTAAQMNSLQSNDFNQTVDTKTASYVLVVGDRGNRIEFNTSGSVTCTVNTGIFSAGDTVMIQNRGAGVVTITAGTATVNTAGSLAVAQWEGGVLYFISASAAIWFEYATPQSGDITGITTAANSGLTGGVTSGDANLRINTTAKGSLMVGSGASTLAELTTGSANQVLTVDSATATGLKWATPTSGSLTLLSTTTLSGTTNTISISASSYTNLFIIFRDIRASANNTVINIRLNGDTGTNYHYGQWRKYQGTSGDFQQGQNQTNFEFSNQIGTSSGANALFGSMNIWRCNDTSQIPVEVRQMNFNDSNQLGWYHTFCKYMASAAISSISLIANGSNTLSGTVYVYGEN